MTIVFYSKHFNTIVYTNESCVPCLGTNKPSLNHFMRESKKILKKPIKSNLARNFKHMTIVFDSNHFNTIIYTK